MCKHCETGKYDEPFAYILKPLLIILVLLLICMLGTGCDRVVAQKREVVGTGVETVSCTHTSMCMTCMPGFDGKMNCGMKLSAFCPGTQKAKVQYVKIITTYESGDVDVRTITTVIEQLSSCF